MKITHSDIEELVSDLRGWVQKKKNPGENFIRTGFQGATKLAIYNFHKDEQLEASQRYLEHIMNRFGLQNVIRRENAESLLAAYTDWWGQANITTVQTRLRIKFPLDQDITLGGEVSRVDINVGAVGYSGILLGVQDPEWGAQLRMPVLQAAIASKLGRDPAEVGVGVQNLDGTGLQVRQYSQREMNEAIREARSLAHTAQRLLEE